MNFGTHRGISLKGATFHFEDGDLRFHIGFVVNEQDCVAYPRYPANHKECRETAIKAIDAILDMDQDAFDHLFHLAGVFSNRPDVFLGFMLPR